MRTFQTTLLLFWVCLILRNTTLSFAESTATPSPLNNLERNAAALDPKVLPTLEMLLNRQLGSAEMKKARQDICIPRITRVSSLTSSTRRAIVETKASIATELLFERSAEAAGSQIESFSLLVEFSPSRVFAQHRRPRYRSDSAGVSIPFSKHGTRAVRFEGALGADILALIPPVKECAVKAIAICPRRYEKIDKLVRSPFALKSVRFLADGKAEGIFAPEPGTVGKVLATIRSSSNIPQSSPWFKEAVGPKTLSAKYELTRPHDNSEALAPFLAINSYPVKAVLQSHVDISSEAEVLRSGSKTASVEVSKITITDKPDLLVGNSELFVEGGECYLITNTSEETI